MTLTDTHCHIHEENYVESELALKRAQEAGVKRLILVGTDEKSSQEAVEFAETHENCWASVGLHPHDAKTGVKAAKSLRELAQKSKKVVAIGECGLDYFYNNSPPEDQKQMLRAQIKLALEFNLPLIFHVRDAFDDFWPIFDEHQGLTGVLHSFTDSLENLKEGLKRGLYIGVNGIATFAADKQEVSKAIPLKNLLLETDAPYLTPAPHRGKVNEPAFVKHVASYLANLQHTNLGELSAATELNATTLFKIPKP